MLIKRSQDLIDQNNNQMFMASQEMLVPEDHILRLINKFFDWNFIYDLTEGMYSNEFSRPALDPVIFFKILFLMFIDGLGSIRNTCIQIQTNIAYRWFLGISFTEKVPDPSTISVTLKRRFLGTDIFHKIFDHILNLCFENDLIDSDHLFIDSTHVKADANPHKYASAFVEEQVKLFEKELLEEVNKDREAHGKKPLKEKKPKKQSKSESEKTRQTKFVVVEGELKELEEVDVDLSNYVAKKVSKTDCQSGWFHKGEHKHNFAYTVQAACDINNYILTYAPNPGNLHDSRTFFDIFEDISALNPKECILDAGYKTPTITKTFFDNDIIPVLPYTRPKTKKGYMKKSEYVYDEYNDCYICPQDQVLNYLTTNREGYREYKSDPAVCVNCPLLEKCTQSKNHTKIVMRHIWEDYLEKAEDIRHTFEYKELYNKRKETIELAFGDNKENHGFRFTRFRGLEKMDMVASLTFASYNLVKMVKELYAQEKRSQREFYELYLKD